jgi:hypothetical protein
MVEGVTTLDRAYGRPVQAMELLGAIAHVDVTALSDAELRAHVSHLREQLQPVPPNGPESASRGTSLWRW